MCTQHCNEEGQLCLAGGAEPSEGIIILMIIVFVLMISILISWSFNYDDSGNVYLGGHPLCHNGWDFPDATVVCRYLRVFFHMIFFGKMNEATLIILQRALGFPGAVNFTIRSQFGSALSFFKIRLDLTKYRSNMFFKTQ